MPCNPYPIAQPLRLPAPPPHTRQVAKKYVTKERQEVDGEDEDVNITAQELQKVWLHDPAALQAPAGRGTPVASLRTRGWGSPQGSQQ